MNYIDMVYDACRGTWNIFNGGEWYYETSDYDDAERVYNSLYWQDDDYDDYDDYDEEVF